LYLFVCKFKGSHLDNQKCKQLSDIQGF